MVSPPRPEILDPMAVAPRLVTSFAVTISKHHVGSAV